MPRSLSENASGLVFLHEVSPIPRVFRELFCCSRNSRKDNPTSITIIPDPKAHKRPKTASIKVFLPLKTDVLPR